MNKSYLVKKRLYLSDRISHFRLMIKRGYHPNFFKELLWKHQIEQRQVLEEERRLK